MSTHDALVKAAYRFLQCKGKSINDPLRPAYHLHPPANWMNDPHGAIYYNRKFHLFYQVNPYGKNWGYISWGHFVSNDLVRWEHAPLALVPESGRLDSNGIFSGSCSLFDSGKGQKPTIFYTGVKYESVHKDAYLEEQRQFTAVCIDDDLMRWRKNREPIIQPNSHPDYREEDLPKILDCMRDPFVWQEQEPKGEGKYYCLIGSAILKRNTDVLHGGNALIYQYDNDSDPKQWRRLNRRFCNVSLGRNWECCNLVRLDGQEIIIVSPEYEDKEGGDLAKTKKSVIWISGKTNSDKGRLLPVGSDDEGPYYFEMDPFEAQTFDHGGWEGFFAATTFVHPDGRCIVWGWSTGGGKEDTDWNGVLSLPREVSWNKKLNYLSIVPLKEMEDLRDTALYKGSNLDNRGLADDEELKSVYGDCVEIDAQMDIANLQEFLVLLWARSVKISIKPQYRAVTLSITDTRTPPSEPFTTEPLPVWDLSRMRLHLFLDRSIIEVFLDDRHVITRRIAPRLALNGPKDERIRNPPEDTRIEFRLREGQILIHKLHIYKVDSILPIG